MGSADFEFDINPEYPLISMLAPSPGWFVGVYNPSLLDGVSNDRKASLTVELVLYDAGTASGLRFFSFNSDTQPAGGISRLSCFTGDTDFTEGTGPAGESVASFMFERIKWS